MRLLHLVPTALLFSTFPVHADTLQYSFAPVYSYEPTHTFSFDLPSNPLGSSFINNPSDQVFAVNGVSATADGATGTFYAVFNYNLTTNGGGGGFVLAGSSYGGPTFSYSLLSGGPLYSGEPNAPTLLAGNFILQEGGAPYGGDPGLLTVTDLTTAATPEPSSLALLTTGLLAAAATLRRRVRTLS